MKRRHLIASAVCLLWSLMAQADIVVLLDGSTVEGDIIKEDDGEITVKGRFGKTVIARKDIREIQAKSSPRTEFLKQHAELEKGPHAKDALAWVTLGDWAKKEGLREEANRVFGEALRLEPNNDKAHEGLGHVRYLGAWMTLDEKRKLEGVAKPVGGEAPVAVPAPVQNPVAGGAAVATGVVGGSTGSSKRQPCGTCNATGYSGWFDCKQCKRSPKPGWLYLGDKMEMCGTCAGKAKLPGVPCKTCVGTGQVDPEKPRTETGKVIPPGYQSCGKCSGSGFETWNPCNQCKRSQHPGWLDMNGIIQQCGRCMGNGKSPGVPCADCNKSGMVRIKK